MNKEIIKPVSDALAQRMKTPIVGAFVLSWILVNHAFILEFMFTSLDAKVEMAKTSELEVLSDFVYPILFTLLYLTVIPAIQLLLDWGVLNTLGESRKNHDVKVARNAAVSTQDYQSKLLDKNMAEWEQEKADLLNQIDEQENKMGELVGQLQDSDNKKGFLELNKQIVEQAINEALDSLEQPRMNAGSDYADQRTREEVCDEVIKILEQVTDRVKEEKIPF
ncbi:hypothetical protein BCS84_18200 [Vibrio cyclitrophicus]|uniref:hypothetical protein n=1 Tax=Vibrio cyclitrophicus TaxID=47951 RepID=UPI0002DB14AF|nr:hypothetical protein [Vibrio cyclitrophicus]OEE17936.1 hypothetical protein OC1_07975 [Vibrio cyclitrophicus ZF207]PMP53279.1 hypothetical protein BCS84_01250 [Vibrio cyclitrophicus]